MSVYQVDPRHDPRWREFVRLHPNATIFHQPEWLEALQRTYGYRCFALTTSRPGTQLNNGIVFCEVNSWLTGSRWVSLPFSDHCEPLIDDREELYTILEWVSHESVRAGNKYVEIRPLDSELLPYSSGRFQRSQEFRIHLLQLAPPFEELSQAFDKDSVQRRVRRAEKEGLVYEEGRSQALMNKFYHLMILTRRRHRLFPQPLAWYRNLVALIGDAATLRVASKGKIPVASMITIRHGRFVVYKYGCSDTRYSKLAANICLFWRAIRDAKDSGAQIFDMGRSDLHNPGLINFKANWGTTNLPLTYWRFPKASVAPDAGWPNVRRVAGAVLSHLPDRCLTILGTSLYRHAG